MRILLPSLALVLGIATSGCWVDVDNNRRAPPSTQTQTPVPTEPTPRVSIDTDRSLEAQPGNGAGLFITYSAGGHWNLKWTCDTKLVPSHSCKFELAVGTHGIHEISSTPANALVEKDAETFQIKTVTTTTIDSVDFRTDPGGAIALTMRIDGQPWPKLIWYVSDGQLSKAPSDPIELVPSAP
jgi:hypothetical protein